VDIPIPVPDASAFPQFTDTLAWPERPTCHDGNWQAERYPGSCVWREPSGGKPRMREHPDWPDPYFETYRTCGYCGSIHPQDLYYWLERGVARLERADRKYGWPHKFYVEGIPNPIAGQLVVTSWSSAYRQNADGTSECVETPHPSPAPATLFVKWYNEHLLDLSDETFAVFSALLEQHAGIHFERRMDEHGVTSLFYRG